MKRSWIIGVAVVLVLAVAAWALSRPHYRRQQERHLLQLARAGLEKRDYNLARLSLQKLLAGDARNVEAHRIGVRLAELSQSPDLLYWRRRLAELDPSVENRLALASTAVRMEAPPFPVATATLNGLRSAASNQPAFHIVAAERAVRLKATGEAEAHLEEAVRLAPTNRLYFVNLAVLQLQSTNNVTAQKARASLLSLTNDATWALPALRSLIADQLNHHNLQEAARFSTDLLARTNAVFVDRLQHLSILRASGGAEWVKYLESLKPIAATNILESAELVSWLNEWRLSREAVGWLKTLPPKAESTMPLAKVAAESHRLEKDWRTLKSSLRTQKWGEEDFLRSAMLAWAARTEGDAVLTKAEWNRAMDEALARFERIPILSSTAWSWGWTNEVDRLLWEAVRQHPKQPWPLLALERAYYAAGNTRGLMKVYSAKLQRQPEDPLAKNDLAAVSLLLKTNVSKASALARDAYTQSPSNPAATSTYAYSLYLTGKAKEGLDVLSKLPEAQLRQPSLAVYYALLLSAAGDREKAQTYRTLAQAGRLLPEERLLISQ